ncbi:hypothetical protein JQ554_08895 [Bradyrhizobium diazoefficiens]|nr:hypothetical protein [Bradyrhizobium diazoefficiens]MBR0964017.1 hypothetical protein [Bradyrhizobium diazoefficiens]MBR0978177.1 hypothetical protein [Bradyrhizobium diazoefficiens]MBR1006108.1 hypothetical protein [Bradyrhizobium diazoefficiens]MBR1014160.1 hypothetical protein [Bradyrhizobium diazoefficiens]MBR1050297.1 hypothetical protein [Bradyrhizobium diazoefficiens]
MINTWLLCGLEAVIVNVHFSAIDSRVISVISNGMRRMFSAEQPMLGATIQSRAITLDGLIAIAAPAQQ